MVMTPSGSIRHKGDLFDMPLVAVHEVLVIVISGPPPDPDRFSDPSSVSVVISGKDGCIVPFNDMVVFQSMFRDGRLKLSSL